MSGSQHFQHAFTSWNAREREGLTVVGRRSMLKASFAGIAGLSAQRLLAAQEQNGGRKKSVILIWMTGGPSHIDTLDPKPLAPTEIRGPFGVIPTKLPGVQICEFLPKYAAMADKFTIIRSVDCRGSNHEPNMVMQTGNRAAAPRVNKEGDKFPALASLIARHREAESRDMPPYVVLNMKSTSHVGWAGYLGKSYDPFIGNNVAGLFNLPGGLTQDRLYSRKLLSSDLDKLRADLDLGGSMLAKDRFTQQAVDLVTGPKAREAFDLSRESAETHERYTKHEWCQQVLLARRLVEAGVRFVTIDLSNHGASGTWDTHGDNIPPYGGIWNGLRPLLPSFDHLFTTLVADLEERGILDDVLVIAMGEFGRSPQIGTQDSGTGLGGGRNHWPIVMSATLAGGGLKHGQVIGSTEKDAGQILSRPVTPGDFAATIFRHMDVPVNLHYMDNRGRPRPVIEQGEPIRELFG
jgi:hypothetical protein